MRGIPVRYIFKMADGKGNFSKTLSVNDGNEDDRNITSDADDNAPTSSGLDNQLTTGSSVNVVDTKGSTQIGENSTIVNGNQIYNITNHNHYHYPFPPAHHHSDIVTNPYTCQPCLRYHNNDHQPLSEHHGPCLQITHPAQTVLPLPRLPSPQTIEQRISDDVTGEIQNSLHGAQAINDLPIWDISDLDFLLNQGSVDQRSNSDDASSTNSLDSPVSIGTGYVTFPNSDGENSNQFGSSDETSSTASRDSLDFQPSLPEFKDLCADPNEAKVKKLGDRRHRRDGTGSSLTLWKFMLELLEERPDVVTWEDKLDGRFRLVDIKLISQMWGEKKRTKNMTFKKLCRGLAYYNKSGLISKVKGSRLEYKFNWQHVPKPFRKN